MQENRLMLEQIRDKSSIDNSLKKLMQEFLPILKELRDRGDIDDSLSFEEKEQALRNSFEIAKKKVPNIDIYFLEELVKVGRNRKTPRSLRSLLNHMKDAEINNTFKDESGNIFYPFVVDLIVAPHLLREKFDHKEKEALENLLSASKFYDKKWIFDISRDDRSKIDFYKKIQLNNMKHYTVSVFATLFNKDYAKIRIVARRLYFAYPNNHRNFAEKPIKTPDPITNIFTYSFQTIGSN